MTTITTLRNKVVTDEPEPDDVLVYVGWSGPSDMPGVLRTFATRYIPISEYQAAVEWAVGMADQMAHPLYVVPLSHNDIFRTARWYPFRDYIAGMSDQERGELRLIIVTTACSVMRDCDDPEIRADMFNVLCQLKVT